MVLSESDRFSTGWVLGLETEFRNKTGRPLLQPAHWDPDPTSFALPPMRRDGILSNVWSNLHRYSFSQDLRSALEAIAQIAQLDPEDGVHAPVTPQNVTIQSSSTQALFQVLLALRRSGAAKALLVTPIYFSIWEATRVLGIDTHYFDTRLRDGGRSSMSDLVATVAEQRPDVLVISHPHYPTGVSWERGAIGRLAEVCSSIGCTLVIDATHSGLAWGRDASRLRDEKLDSLDHVALVQSPAKAYFLNGARFAHVLAKPSLIDLIEDQVHVTSGAISQLQAEIATMTYEARAGELAKGGIGGGLAQTIEANIRELGVRFEAACALLHGTRLRFYPASSGLFTMIECLDMPSDWTTEHEFVRRLLFEQETLTFSGSCYRASPSLNNLSIRVTLAVPRHELVEGIRRMAITAEDLVHRR